MLGYVDLDLIWMGLTGLLGLLAYFLMKFQNPDDDTVSGSLRQIFHEHSRTTLLSLIGYVVTCIVLRQMGDLNYASAVLAGFTNQAVFEDSGAILREKLGKP